MQHRRSGGAPAVPHGVRRKRLRPHRPAFHVEAEHAHVPEASVYPLAIRDRRLRGVAVLGVSRPRRGAAMHEPFPEHFAGEQVQAEHFPLVFARWLPSGVRRRDRVLSSASPHRPAPTTVVRNTRSPHAMGDDQPRPGICVFQATFSVADQRSGRLALVGHRPRARPEELRPDGIRR